VQICIQRLLGRDVYSDREKFAWSTVLATQGIEGLIDQILSTDEYLDNFGDSAVPYQRRRLLPQRSIGDLPFARMARYDTAYKKRIVDTQLNLQRFKQTTSPVAWIAISLLTFGLLYWAAFITLAGPSN